jgi:cysteinyl-tRNA synthetase
MIAGARVEVAPYKRDPQDFILWKPSKPGEPSWPSPAGIAAPGRPGWHIECSAMAWKFLGETFDIHGGGIDLVFPHHENEIAQSRCAFHAPAMARTWMHNGFLQVEGEKMAKSAGNFVTIRELLKDWPGLVVRFAMLQTHYRQPIDWTASRMEAARQEVGDWAALYYDSDAEHDFHYRKIRKIPPQPAQELLDALKDDLNTPKAVSVLREQFSKEISKGVSKEFFQNCEFLGLLDLTKIGAFEGLHVSGGVRHGLLSEARSHVMKLRAGIANNLPEVVTSETEALLAKGMRAEIAQDGHIRVEPISKSDELDIATIEKLIRARATAREARNFAEADRIRDELVVMGIELEDKKDGTTWKVK